jgi:hypothetical protein
MDYQLAAMSLLGALILYGGPEMMRSAQWAEAMGSVRTARVLSVLAWVTLGIVPILALALVRGWV